MILLYSIDLKVLSLC